MVRWLRGRALWFGYSGGAKALGSNRQGDDDGGSGDDWRSRVDMRACSFYFLFFIFLI